MDYEFRIKQAELELAHLREMQQIGRERMDSQDRWLEAMQTVIERTAANLDLLTVQTGKLAEKLDNLEGKVDQLVKALLGSRNGGRSGEA